MKDFNRKLNIQTLQNWMAFVKSITDFYHCFIALTVVFFQQIFLIFMGSKKTLYKSFFLKFEFFKCLVVGAQENLNSLKIIISEVEVFAFKHKISAYFKINIKLIKQKTFLSEIITIFMLYFKPANFVNSKRLIIHYTH